VNLQLARDYAGRDCTLGRLTIGALTLYTLERLWIPIPTAPCGHPDTSCLPPGLYSLALHDTPKFPRHFALANEQLGVYADSVPAGKVGRCACLIHTGNYVTDVEGCIIVGRNRRLVGDEWTLLESVLAYADLRAALPWQAGNSLTIEYSPGAIQAA
jgi:hypothetical protein